MANITRVTRVRRLSDSDDEEDRPILVFYRAPGEGLLYPGDVVSLLNSEGIQTGTVRARNPITHDQWWIPVLAAAGAPYVKALASVIRAWLKECNGRKVQVENDRVKISAGTAAEVERLLSALTKHGKQLGSLHVTKSTVKAPAKKTAKKRSK